MWSGFGAGYAWAPLVLPVAALSCSRAGPTVRFCSPPPDILGAVSRLDDATPGAAPHRHPGTACRAHPRAARHALRDRPRRRHEPPGARGRRAAGVRARGRLDARRRASTSPSTRPATSSGGCRAASPSCPRSGAARTSTRRRTAGASTARSGRSLALDAAEAIGAGDPPRRTVAAMAFRLEEGPRFGARLLRQPRGVRHARRRRGRPRSTPTGSRSREAFAALGYGELPRAGWLEPAARRLRRGAHRAGPDARGHGRAARHRHLDRGDGRSRDHVQRPARARGHGADGAPLRRARRRRALRRRRPRRRALAARRGRHDRPPDRRARRDQHDSRARRAVRRPARARRRARRGAGRRRRRRGARRAAEAARCEVVVEQRWRYEAVADERPARAPRCERAVAALGVEPVELPSGAGHDAAILALAGVPSAMLFVRSDAGGVSHAPEEATGTDAVVARRAGARGRAARAGGRVIDWDALARPSLRGLVRYDPGQSRDSIRAQLGLDALEPLHWNEDRFEPPRHVLEAAAAEVFNAALYPEHLFADFRDGLARWLDVPADVPHAGARRAGPDRGARAGLRRPRHAGRRAEPDLWPVRRRVARRPAASSRASRPPGSRSISTRSRRRAVETDARLVWICDPNNPTGTLIEPARVGGVPRPAARRLRRDRRRDVHRLRRSRRARRPPPRRARGPARDRHPLVLEDPRPGRAARRLRDLGSRGRAAARPRAGAVQRQSRRARRRHRGRRRSGLRRPAARRGGRRARACSIAELAGGRHPRRYPSQSNFVLVELGVDDVAVCEALKHRGILVRGGTEFGLPGIVARDGRARAGHAARGRRARGRRERPEGDAHDRRRSRRHPGGRPRPRSRRLRPQPAGHRVARRRARRDQPRARLRGGLGVLRGLGRRSQRRLGRVRRPGRAAAPARSRHRGALRVRQPRRRVAARAHLRRGGRAGDRLRRRRGARAEPGRRRVDARARPRPARPRLALDRGLDVHARGGARADPARDRDVRARARQPADRLELARLAEREHARHPARARRLPLPLRGLRRRPALLRGRRRHAADPRDPVLQDLQRLALPHEPGLREPARLPRHARLGPRRARARGRRAAAR